MKKLGAHRNAIHCPQVHTGPEGLDIPELPEDATDDEIIAALANLDAAQERLLNKRKALAGDAEEFFSLSMEKITNVKKPITEEQARLIYNRICGILRESREGISGKTGIEGL